jgi:hypothetical protein
MLSISVLFYASIGAILAWVLNLFLVKPYLYIRFYRKQGIKGWPFKPPFGQLFQLFEVRVVLSHPQQFNRA